MATYFDIILFLFCTLLIVICCENRWCNISSLNVFKLLLQIAGHGERFSARRRSEGIISRATGVVWIILILVQNDREKKTKQKTLLMVLFLATLGLRQKLTFRDVPM